MKSMKVDKTRRQLFELIDTWKLNQAVLAEALGMKQSTFRLKLNETNNKYFFTAAEFAALASVIDRMMAAFKNCLDALDDDLSDLM